MEIGMKRSIMAMAVGLLALSFNVTVFADKIPEVPTAVTMEVLKGSMKASPTLAEDGTIQLNNAYCSIMVRKKVKKKRSFIHDGIAYRLCCKKCLEAMAADSEHYVLAPSERAELDAWVGQGAI